MKRIYLDHNATSPMRPEVLGLWRELAEADLGNPSSLHQSGRRARHRIDEARERVAGALGVDEDCVIFTSGGTESNNLALLGAFQGHGAGSALVTTTVEHSSVQNTATALEQSGVHVTRVAVDAAGRLDKEQLTGALETPDLKLVSIQAANNEVGVIHPIGFARDLLANLRPEARPLLHTDAVQALGRVEFSLQDWGADLASFSVHKVGGPVGTGVLIQRNPKKLPPLFHGGGQEFGLRPGTESTAAISAAALAVELAVSERVRYAAHTRKLSQELWLQLEQKLPGIQLIGPGINDGDRLPNTLNVIIPGSDGKVLVTALDLCGLEVSAGSACASGALEPSHVLLAMGLDEDKARAGLRISLGRSTTAEDCKHAVEILVRNAEQFRAT